MRTVIKLLIYFIGLLICLVISFYFKTTVYRFPEPIPFHGDAWYNPYEILSPYRIKANFHAHTKSWSGLTNGGNSDEELIDAYRKRNYNSIGISNYHCISDAFAVDSFYIPLYEHGVNINKIHNLVIDASHVRMPGYPFHFSLHQTQHMLQRTSVAGNLNVLAHPEASNISFGQMAMLSGYDLLEVGNTRGINTAHWDAVLSSGKPIWLLSNDDTHDLQIEPTFIRWNIILPKENSAASAIEALSLGQHYGVDSYRMKCENFELLECAIRNDSLIVRMSNNVNRIDLIGQNGEQKATIAGKDRIKYALAVSDTYIRTEIHMDECVYYLNPVFRTSSSVATPSQSVYPATHSALTWIARIAVFILFGLTIWVTIRLDSKFTRRPGF